MIVLEDLHWTDEASARLLAFVARRIASARVLIIATVREEDIVQGSTLRDDFSELILSSAASKVELRGLSQAHTFELIRRLAYSKNGMMMLANTHAGMWETSRGNPFMIVEMVRAMRKVRRSSRLEHWRFPTGSAKSSSRVSNDWRSLFGPWSRWRRWSAASSTSL